MKKEFIPEDKPAVAPVKPIFNEVKSGGRKIEYIGERPEGSYMDTPGSLALPTGKDDPALQDTASQWVPRFSLSA